MYNNIIISCSVSFVANAALVPCTRRKRKSLSLLNLDPVTKYHQEIQVSRVSR